MKHFDLERIDNLYYKNLDIKDRTLYFGAWQPTDTVEIESGGWEVSDLSAQNMIKGLYVLNNISNEDIHIIWFSYGGDWDAGMAIYDFIQSIESKVIITVYGRVRSMGTIILQAAHKRILSPNSIFMIHYGSAAFEHDHAKDFLNFSDVLKQDNETMENIYLNRIRESHPRFTRSKLSNMMKNDKYMRPSEAIELGLADEIINPLKKKKKR